MVDPGIHVGRSLARGGAWMVAARWGLRGLGLVNTFILARLLSPGDFGLVAMAMVVITLVEVPIQAGQDMALIRHRNPLRMHYDSVWTLSVLLGIILTLLLWMVADFGALYFHEPRVAWLIRVLALRTLVGGFENIGMVDFRRDLRFDRVFVFMVIQRLFGALLAIAFALLFQDWRALVVGILGGRVLGVAFSYVVHPYRPRLCTRAIREVLAFTSWMLFVNICQYLNDRADELAVGSLGNPAQMGLYNVGADVATAPTAETVLPAIDALFPVFARLTDDPSAMRTGYLDVLSVVCILSVALGGGMSLIAADFVAVVLGTKWVLATPIVRVLAIAGGLFAIMQNGIPVLTATGHERLAAQLTAARAAAILFAVGSAAFLGDAMAIAYARLAVTLAFIPGIFFALSRVLPITFGDFVARLWRPIAAGVVMAGSVLLVHARAPEIPALRLIIDIVIGAAVYPGMVLLLWALIGCPRGPEAAVVNWIISRPRGINT